MTNFYENMKSLIEPIADNVSKIGIIAASIIALGTDPETGMFSIPYLTGVMFVPDASDVFIALVSHDDLGFFPFVEAVGIKGKYIYTTLCSVVPSHTFHIPSCIFHGYEIGNFDLDFSWFDNYKIYWDVLMNGFLVTGYIIWLFVTVQAHLRGRMVIGNEPQEDKHYFAEGWDGDY